jgi:hypothetical protein
MPVTTNSSYNATLSFSRVAGAMVSYQDFNEFRLFCPKSKILLAKATIPNGIQIAVPGQSTSTTPKASSSSASTPAPQATNPEPPKVETPSAAGDRIMRDPYSIILLTFLVMAVVRRLL